MTRLNGTTIYRASRIKSDGKRRDRELHYVTNKEDIKKCLACPKPECTNCLGYRHE